MATDANRVVLLAHGEFPDRAKTAIGVLRYGDREVVAVLDREHAGDRVSEHVDDVPDAPIVASMADVPPCDELIVGISPIGGGFEESWRPDVSAALRRGCDASAGLHDFLADDDEFARLAAGHGCTLTDVRKPPSDLTVARGTAGEVDARVVATVGTDCSTGKLTTSEELVRGARERGIDAAVVPTGQTGILIEDWGVAVDRVVSDFAAGATERVVHEAADHDLLVVEGQGAIGHPAYSGVTASLLHGARPDALGLCHVAGREVVHGYEETAIPPVDEVAAGYESFLSPVVDAAVVAGSLATHGIEDGSEAREAIAAFEEALGVPATDPVRFGTDDVLDALLGEGD